MRRLPKWKKGILLVFLTASLIFITYYGYIGAVIGYNFDPKDGCRFAGMHYDRQFPRYEVDHQMFPISVHCNAEEDLVPPSVNITLAILALLSFAGALWTPIYIIRSLKEYCARTDWCSWSVVKELSPWRKAILLASCSTVMTLITAFYYFMVKRHYTSNIAYRCLFARVRYDRNFPNGEMDGSVFPITVHCNARDNIVAMPFNVIYACLILIIAAGLLGALFYLAQGCLARRKF